MLQPPLTVWSVCAKLSSSSISAGSPAIFVVAISPTVTLSLTSAQQAFSRLTPPNADQFLPTALSTRSTCAGAPRVITA
jgi:hypothetical protein